MAASLDQVVSQIQNLNANLSQLNKNFNNAFPTITGTFTLAAATNTVVSNVLVSANSKVFLTPTNTSAAITVRTLGIFHSATNPGTSFTVSTQNGSAVGNETFEFFATNT